MRHQHSPHYSPHTYHIYIYIQTDSLHDSLLSPFPPPHPSVSRSRDDPVPRLGQADLGLAHHEPLAPGPGGGGVHHLRPIEDAPRQAERKGEQILRSGGVWVAQVWGLKRWDLPEVSYFLGREEQDRGK